jgi:TolB protein
MVIYVQSGGQTHSLGVIRSNGAKVKDGISLEPAGGPAWSPSGTEIAFFGEPGIGVANPDFFEGEGVWRIDFPPSEPTQLYSVDHVKNIAWSPSGVQLAFEIKPPGQPAEIVVIDARDGQQLFRFEGEQPAWSPDGGNLIVRLDPPDQGCGLWQVALDGNPEQQITDDCSDSYPALSPDGSYLAFSSERTGNWDIHLMRLPYGNPQPLTGEQGIDTTPVFSRDGQSIFYRSNSFHPDWQIVMMELDGSGKYSVKNGLGPSDDYGLARPAIY